MRTTSQAVVAALTVVLAATGTGCSSHPNPVGAVASGQPSPPASTQLSSAPSAPASSASATPTDAISGSPSVTPAPPFTSPPTSAPTPSPAASTSVPPRGTHAITVVAGLACPDPGSAGQSASPSPKPLPPSLAIKAVVRCETVQRSYPGLGNWSVSLPRSRIPVLAPS